MSYLSKLAILHRDENGASIAEMVLIAGMIVVPLIIVTIWYVTQRADELIEDTGTANTKKKELIQKAN